MKVFYSQGILEETDDFVHQLWYDFLREMRMFAKRRLLRFDTRDITKTNLDKEDFQYLATSQGPKEQDMSTQNDFALSEAIKFEGGKKTSYRVLEKTKLIAKHKKSIEDESFGARTRRSNIQSLFIENQEGERFKYPFIHIAGAKAMQRHVANGGRPYDELGQAIVKMSEDIAHLAAFNRQVGSPDNLNNAEQVNEITGKTATKLQSLKRTIEGLCNQNYYEKWSENFVPNAGGSELDEATIENYKSAFTVNSFKEDLTQYFPLIHSIMQEAGEVDLEEYVEEAAAPWEDEDEAEKREKEDKENKDTKGKDGAEHGGHSRATHLAKNAIPKEKSAAESIDAFEEWANDLVEGDSDEDMMEPPKETEQPTAKAIAEFVYTMYNKEHKKQGLGPFPKGDTGVISAVTNKFGEETEEIATQFVEFLSNGSVERAADEGVVDTVKKVGGAIKKVGGAIKKAAGQAMDIIAPGDDELLRRLREPNEPKSSDAPKPMATPNRRQQKESSDFDVILKLAGVQK